MKFICKFHTLSTVFLTLNWQRFTASVTRFTSCEILLSPPNLYLKLYNVLNPATLLPLSHKGEDHDCKVTVSHGNSLIVHCLGLQASTAGSVGSISGRGTKIPQATWSSPKQKQTQKTKTKQTNRKQCPILWHRVLSKDVTKSKLAVLAARQANKSEMRCWGKAYDFIRKASRPRRWRTKVSK